jgi:hypothetical protein
VVLDLRNIYEPAKMAELGYKYIGVGRGTEQIRDERKF